MEPGYYWAKHNNKVFWSVVLVEASQVYNVTLHQYEPSQCVVHFGLEDEFELSGYTFGPKIEQPKELA